MTAAAWTSLAPQTPRLGAALWRAASVYALTTLLVLHATFRGLYADLDAAIYAAWYTELGALSALDFFERLQESGWIFQAREQAIAKFESGFSLLSWLLASVGLSVQGYFAVIAALSLYPKAYIALRYSPNPLLSIVWYASFCYLLLEMNAMRAGLAAALMLMAIPALLQQRWPKYFVLIGVASAFHTAALIALLLPAARALSRHALLLTLVVVSAIVLSLFDITVALALLGGTFEKIAEYKAAFDTGFGDVAYVRLNPINSSSVPFMVIGAMLVYKAFGRGPERFEHDRFAAVVVLLPILALFAFASFPIVGSRLSELLCVYQMIFVTRLVDQYPTLGLGRLVLAFTLVIQFSIQQYLTLHVDALYFVGAARPAMLLLIEQKTVIDAVLAEIFSTL